MARKRDMYGSMPGRLAGGFIGVLVVLVAFFLVYSTVIAEAAWKKKPFSYFELCQAPHPPFSPYVSDFTGLPVPAFSPMPDKPKAPINALLVTGGCCHDYEKQKVILTEGITKRANVKWTIVHHPGDKRDVKLELYQKADWAKGYDVVVHNECYGAVDDVEFVKGIVKPHFEGLPAVVLHCSMHSYRAAKSEDWHQFVGVTTSSHEKNRPVEIKRLKGDHPVMKGFPESWKPPGGELYKIDKVWDTATPLAQAYGVDTKKDHTIIWVNTYGKGRVFGTTEGHHNETMSHPIYLDLVTRGLLWACQGLDDNGKPLPEFEPVPAKK